MHSRRPVLLSVAIPLLLALGPSSGDQRYHCSPGSLTTGAMSLAAATAFSDAEGLVVAEGRRPDVPPGALAPLARLLSALNERSLEALAASMLIRDAPATDWAELVAVQGSSRYFADVSAARSAGSYCSGVGLAR